MVWGHVILLQHLQSRGFDTWNRKHPQQVSWFAVLYLPPAICVTLTSGDPACSSRVGADTIPETLPGYFPAHLLNISLHLLQDNPRKWGRLMDSSSTELPNVKFTGAGVALVLTGHLGEGLS